MPERERCVTTAQFVDLLWHMFCDKLGRSQGAAEGARALEIALRHGWIEPQDAKCAGETLRRNQAARILHEFLRRETGEADEEDWEEAKALKDIYDCRTCVRHVAQVYCKGIMSARDGIFGMRQELSPEEARESVTRAISPSRRLKASGACGINDGRNDAGAIRLTKEEALRWTTSIPNLTRIDVRTPGEYEKGHPEGFVNVPLMRLLEAPNEVCANREDTILIGCDGGYRSEIAAMRLIAFGCENVGYFGWE